MAREEERKVVRKVWADWKMKWEARRRERWELSLGEREGRFVAWSDKNVLKASFGRWKTTYQTGLATTHYDDKLMRSALEVWHHLTFRLQDLRMLLENWEADTDTLSVGRAFDTWRAKAARRVLEDVVVERADRRVLKTVLRKWKMAWSVDVVPFSRPLVVKTYRPFLSSIDLAMRVCCEKNSGERHFSALDCP